MKILLVEDEKRIALAIKEGLEQESFAVDVCDDGEEGYNTAGAEDYLAKPFSFDVLLGAHPFVTA